ncbi:cell division protein FtsL [Halalkalibacillus halophilus]|uniref:cell division protein FtsL n=1 Tax=Halalkalibacillus halophilus TaxID=392827 RepID=UPI00040A5F66|nr:cell division protein FtsL [Halalkalibacillus halophilus]
MAIERIRAHQTENPHHIPRRQEEPTIQPTPKKSTWFTKGEKVLYTAGVSIMAIVATFVVSYSSSVDSLNRDMQNLNAEVQEVQSKNVTLQAEVQELSNPNRILTIAEENGLNIRHAQVKQANNTP